MHIFIIVIFENFVILINAKHENTQCKWFWNGSLHYCDSTSVACFV